MRKLIAAASVGAALFAASSAFASTIVWTASGAIYDVGAFDGYDGGNLFGGGSLVGDAFTLTFTWDSTIGFRSSDPNDPYPYEGLYGGMWSGVGGPSPGSAALTINGQTYNFLGEQLAGLLVDQTTAYSQLQKTYLVGGVEDYAGVNLQYTPVPGPNFLSSINQPFEIDCGPTDACFGNAWIHNYYLDTDTFAWRTHLDFDVSHISITSTDPVNTSPAPEPANWVLMLLGFVGAGMSLRRRECAHR